MAKATRKLCFIVNPIAGNGKNKDYCTQLMAQINTPNAELHCIELERTGQASEIAKQYTNRTDCTLISVGGDGTFNEIASSLVYAKVPVAIVPRGSGNGLARMIKVPERKKDIGRYLLSGQEKQVDVGKVNNQYFFCTCGFGFDAHIAAVFNKGKVRGGQRYVKSVLRQLLSYSPVEAEFTLDGKEYKGKFFLVTFSNANQYGNNAYIAPDADLSDGLLHATILHPFPQVLAPLMTTALLGGFINKMPFIETVTFKKAEIKSVSSPCFHCDGESLDMQYPTTVEVLNKALRLIVPKRYHLNPQRNDRIKLLNDQLESIFKDGKMIHY